MFKSLCAALVVLATTASASSVHSSNPFVTRQIDRTSVLDGIGENTPAVCRSTCDVVRPIIAKCSATDNLVEECVTDLCKQPNINAFIDCVDCGFKESGRIYTSDEAALIKDGVSGYGDSCKALDSSVSIKEIQVPTSDNAPSSTNSASPSQTSSPTASAPESSSTGNAASQHGPAGVAALVGGVILAAVAL